MWTEDLLQPRHSAPGPQRHQTVEQRGAKVLELKKNKSDFNPLLLQPETRGAVSSLGVQS